MSTRGYIWRHWSIIKTGSEKITLMSWLMCLITCWGMMLGHGLNGLNSKIMSSLTTPRNPSSVRAEKVTSSVTQNPSVSMSTQET